MKIANIKWIFFDVGSTLVDEEMAYQYRIKKAIEGTEITYKQFYNTMISYYKQNKKGDLETIKYFGLSLPKWNYKYEFLYPEVENCLKDLSQRYKLGVIANQPLGTADRLEAFGILKYIKEIVASAEVGFSKPDQKIFLTALERTKCKADSAVMVGDRLENDISPANLLGIKTVRIMQGFGKYSNPKCIQEIPDYTVNNLYELTNLFEK